MVTHREADLRTPFYERKSKALAVFGLGREKKSENTKAVAQNNRPCYSLYQQNELPKSSVFYCH